MPFLFSESRYLGLTRDKRKCQRPVCGHPVFEAALLILSCSVFELNCIVTITERQVARPMG